uniref:C2H2-type domain-containing protein n=1 Tax=Esox lucius TaxID=8010 RepID=A0A3P9A5J7_ESOLU
MESDPKVEREDQGEADGVRSDTEEEAETAGHACALCGRSFPLLSSLSQHMRRHTGEKPYKCPYCDHRVAQKGSLKAHIRSHKLGLLSQSLGKREGEEGSGSEKRQRAEEDPEQVDSPASEPAGGSAAKKPKFNGKAKKRSVKKKSDDAVNRCDREEQPQTTAEYDSTLETARGVGEGNAEAAEGSFPCGSCSQVFPRAQLLKAHMKKHRGSLDHGCRICGRRFRQAWFLQSHMRIHRTKAQLRGGGCGESPGSQATVNGVPQDPASLANDGCLYELCAGCGNFFYDRKTLRLHERVHKQTHTPSKQSHAIGKSPQADPDGGSQSPAAKRRFLECLNLRAAGAREAATEGSLGRRIPELDPVCSYQAWQLVTRGRVAEVTEKGCKETLAGDELALDQENGEHVPLRQEKRTKQLDSSQSKKKKGPLDAIVNGGGGDISYQEGDKRNGCTLLNGLSPETLEILQKKKVRESNQSSKQSTKSNSASQLSTASPEDFLSGGLAWGDSHGSPHTSGYMEYLRLKSTSLSRPYWNPNVGPPVQERAALRGRSEKSRSLKVKGQSSQDAAVNVNLLNLSAPPEGQEEDGGVNPVAESSEGALVRHQCPFCAHTTHYPEVLWIHQRLSHRVDSGSSLAPKWAPHVNGLKCPKAAGRRTGPPPFLEGKDCPALPVPRGQRTQPPCSLATQPPAGGAKRPKIHTATKTTRAQSNTSQDMGLGSARSPQGGGKSLLPQKKKLNRPSHAVGNESPRIKTEALPKTAAATTLASASVRGFSQQSSAPKSRSHQRTGAVGSLLPQEGLGFILARNHGRADYPLHRTPDRTHLHQPLPRDPPASPKGHDLWSVMNMFGGPGSSGYLAPTNVLGHGKKDSTAGDCRDTPMDIDILGLLKNYKPQDLAALYQHWGFVRMTQTGVWIGDHWRRAHTHTQSINATPRTSEV